MKKLLSLLLMLFMSIGMCAEDYVKITSTADLTDGTYLIVYETDGLIFDGSLSSLDAVGNTVNVTIANSTITSTATIDASAFEYNATDKTLKSMSGYYIGQTGDANGLKASKTTKYVNTITFDGSGNVNIVSAGAYLRYNSASNQLRFRYYKSSTYTGQKAIQLYKRSSEVTPPEPEIAEISTIAEFLALENNKQFKYNGTLTCVQNYSDGNHRYLYLGDNTGGIVIYDPDNDTPEYVTTDIVPGGWTATKTLYKNLPEAINATNFVAKTDNQNINPIEITISEATTTNLLGAWIVVRNVLIREKTVNNKTVYYITSDEIDELELYFGHTTPFELPDGMNETKDTDRYDMYGILGVYNNTRQIMPTGIGQNGEIITDNIETIENSINKVLYYNIQGICSEKPFNGLNIVVTEYSNGYKKIIKQIYKF